MRNFAVSVSLFGGLLCSIALDAGGLQRPFDPVVLTGADVSSLQGIAPGDLVAFRFEGHWVQIPVQVDERAVVNFTQVYNGNTLFGDFSTPAYTDPETFAGPDPNAALDADDEIVFMAKDAGTQQATGLEPAGVVAHTGIEVKVADPLGGDAGYAYLFRQAGALDPGAGAQYVTYDFNLLSGDYKQTYDTGGGGGNPENSTILTDYYLRHFSDRWIEDQLEIYAGNATGIDILDRHKNMFAPDTCGRSEYSFSMAEGAFIVNKSGPVRAIRAYVGANSGPRTQREHVYYQAREDVRTWLRVHGIDSIMDFYDYSPAATGMHYYNNNAPAGVPIDGVEDAVPAGPIRWEMVQGAQGSLILLSDLVTNLTLDISSYYRDTTTPTDLQCTGSDPYAYGASGLWVLDSIHIANTDPVLGSPAQFELRRVNYFDAPGAPLSEAQHRRDLLDNPLALTFKPWTSGGLAGLPATTPAGLLILFAAIAKLATKSRTLSPRAVQSGRTAWSSQVN
jgi:hypothetical protein